MPTVVIIPTLHERDNLKKLIPEILSRLPAGEILIADDHSEDGTKELAGDRVHVLDRLTDHGYGKAVLDGFRWAIQHGADYIVTMDADFSHDPKDLPMLFKKLDTADVAIGSRYVSGGSISNWSWHRRLLSRFSNWYVHVILHTGIKDNTTGFMVYRRNVIERLLASPPHSEGYAFLVEVKNLVKNFSVAEHPIIYTERREGQSKMSFKNIWEAVWLPWRIRFGMLK